MEGKKTKETKQNDKQNKTKHLHFCWREVFLVSPAFVQASPSCPDTRTASGKQCCTSSLGHNSSLGAGAPGAV
jgi:hypothetical protein